MDKLKIGMTAAGLLLIAAAAVAAGQSTGTATQGPAPTGAAQDCGTSVTGPSNEVTDSQGDHAESNGTVTDSSDEPADSGGGPCEAVSPEAPDGAKDNDNLEE